MKYNDNGEYKDIYVKAFDTLPVGAIVEFDGATIPSGWEDIGNNKIKKTSQYIEGGATLPNYSLEEINTGSTWIDGKPIYRKVFTGTTPSSSSYISLQSNVETIVNSYGQITYDATAGNKHMINYIYDTTNNYYSSVNYSGGDNTAYFNFSNNLRSKDYHITLEYTKTTD